MDATNQRALMAGEDMRTGQQSGSGMVCGMYGALRNAGAQILGLLLFWCVDVVKRETS